MFAFDETYFLNKSISLDFKPQMIKKGMSIFTHFNEKKLGPGVFETTGSPGIGRPSQVQLDFF